MFDKPLFFEMFYSFRTNLQYLESPPVKEPQQPLFYAKNAASELVRIMADIVFSIENIPIKEPAWTDYVDFLRYYQDKITLQMQKIAVYLRVGTDEDQALLNSVEAQLQQAKNVFLEKTSLSDAESVKVKELAHYIKKLEALKGKPLWNKVADNVVRRMMDVFNIMLSKRCLDGMGHFYPEERDITSLLRIGVSLRVDLEKEKEKESCSIAQELKKTLEMVGPFSEMFDKNETSFRTRFEVKLDYVEVLSNQSYLAGLIRSFKDSIKALKQRLMKFATETYDVVKVIAQVFNPVEVVQNCFHAICHFSETWNTFWEWAKENQARALLFGGMAIIGIGLAGWGATFLPLTGIVGTTTEAVLGSALSMSIAANALVLSPAGRVGKEAAQCNAKIAGFNAQIKAHEQADAEQKLINKRVQAAREEAAKEIAQVKQQKLDEFLSGVKDKDKVELVLKNSEELLQGAKNEIEAVNLSVDQQLERMTQQAEDDADIKRGLAAAARVAATQAGKYPIPTEDPVPVSAMDLDPESTVVSTRNAGLFSSSSSSSVPVPSDEKRCILS